MLGSQGVILVTPQQVTIAHRRVLLLCRENLIKEKNDVDQRYGLVSDFSDSPFDARRPGMTHQYVPVLCDAAECASCRGRRASNPHQESCAHHLN